MREHRHPHCHVDPRQPRNDTRPGTNPPVFAWKPTEGATAFRLKVARDADFADICLDTQRSFLADHLGSWGPEYGRRMAAVADHDFYRAVGSFLAMWLDADMERLGVVAVGVGDGSGTAARPIAVSGVGWPNSEDGCGGEGDEAWP